MLHQAAQNVQKQPKTDNNGHAKSTVESGSSPATPRNTVSRRFSVAPMMDWTTHECRYFLRLISKRALLYTEMVTTGALIHGDSARFLRHDQSEHPIALRSEEHTSELQSRPHLVCRLLLEKKKNK